MSNGLKHTKLDRSELPSMKYISKHQFLPINAL